MPHRLTKLKAALNQTPNDTYSQFQALRDGLVASLIDWPAQKWDIADEHLPTDQPASQNSRAWLNALTVALAQDLPTNKSEATPERLKDILALTSIMSMCM
ncbi:MULTISPECIES: hypothetical protein [unclassified Pseudomonas]|uniref:hypothetical protein n=1 Tax=unclassified Pseudomonas TaxID=196821 RepID=UPI001474B7B1|nr:MULTISPECIES: hypothetical protein [unclassified Pseudomonas]NMX94288.1 hypothetical protein [Pseudomonas sp. WS 5086]NMY48134.1 hypothetical protein [Pseudomonas sp. WS 5027]